MKKRSENIGIYGRMPEKKRLFSKKRPFFLLFQVFSFFEKRNQL